MSMTPERRWMMIFCGCLAAWAGFWVFAVQPGESTLDTLMQYRQGLEGVYSDAHPTLYSMMLGFSGTVVGNGILVLFAQVLMGVAALCGLAWHLRAAGTASKVALVLLSFNPLVWGQWVSLWKDEPLALCALSSFVLCLFGRGAWCIPLLIVATCFRHNGITLVLPLALWIGWEARKINRWVAGLVVFNVMLFSLMSPKVLNLAVGATDGKAAAPTLVFDVAGAYSRDKGAYMTGPFGDVRLYHIRRRHRPHTARYLTSNGSGVEGLRHKDFDDERYAVLKKEWVRIVTARPDLWIRHRAEFACNLVNICMPRPMEPFGRTNPEIGGEVGRVDPERLSHKIVNGLRWGSSFLARGWIWLVVVVGAVGLAIRRRRWVEVAIGASGLCYLGGNILLAPSSPFRYHLPLLMAAMVLVPLALRSDPEGD